MPKEKTAQAGFELRMSIGIQKTWDIAQFLHSLSRKSLQPLYIERAQVLSSQGGHSVFGNRPEALLEETAFRKLEGRKSIVPHFCAYTLGFFRLKLFLFGSGVAFGMADFFQCLMI